VAPDRARVRHGPRRAGRNPAGAVAGGYTWPERRVLVVVVVVVLVVVVAVAVAAGDHPATATATATSATTT